MLTVPVYEKSHSRSSRVLHLQKPGPGSSQTSNNGSTANDDLVADRSTVLSFKGSAIFEVGNEFEELILSAAGAVVVDERPLRAVTGMSLTVSVAS